MTDRMPDEQLDREISAFLALRAVEVANAPSAAEMAARISKRVGTRKAGPRLTPQLLWVLLAGLLIAALIGAVLVGARLLRNDVLPSRAGNGWIAISANPKLVSSGEYGDIYLLAEDGDLRRIIGSDGDGIAQACPSFSPDGRRLAYGEGRPAVQPDDYPFRDRSSVAGRGVVVVGLNDHGDASPPIMRVTPPADSGEVPCPEWSPDGNQVAFRIGSDLWVADAASGMTTGFPVAEAPWGQQGFEWSRDGSRVAVAEPGRIRMVRVDGVSATLIPVPGDTPSSLDWTAGDDRIIYIGNERSGDVLAVKVVGVDATNDTQLTLRGTAALQLWASDAVVSPDGTQVAFVQVTTRCVNDECGTDSTRILTMDTHGSNLTEVATPPDFGASGLQWSPDGERLLFGSGGSGVVSVPVAPGSPEIVLPNGELNLEYSASELTWQPVVP